MRANHSKSPEKVKEAFEAKIGKYRRKKERSAKRSSRLLIQKPREGGGGLLC